MSSYGYDQGLIVSVDGRLMEYEPDKNRSFVWTDDWANQIAIYYSNDSNQLCMLVLVAGYYLYDNCVYVETDEWNGVDDLFHNLSFELIGNQLTGLRDDKVQFELVDDDLLGMTNSGYLTVKGTGNIVCYDNVCLISLSEEQIPAICGDTNGDETVNVSDAVHIINYIFGSGGAPDPLSTGDTNCDTMVNVSDAVYIINYVFVGGNPPCDTNGDSTPDC